VHTSEVWTYREKALLGVDISASNIVGYEVEALDGSIGKIDEATFEAGAGYVVVDTGPWIFGKKVMLPAGVIREVDDADERVFVNRTKDQIKNAPEFDDSSRADEKYRGELASYYGQGGPGFRSWDESR
jgi:hypothetical protein